MKTQNTGLSAAGIRFFSWVQLENITQVRTGDLVKHLKLSSKQEADLFYKLSSKGFIIKLWRGFYLTPQHIPVQGQWSPSPYLIINSYMKHKKADFHISGPAVFNKYGFSNQMSGWFTVYNNKISKKLYILGYHLDFTKTKQKGMVKKIKSYNTAERFIGVALSSPEQALLDVVYDYKKYGSLPKVYYWIKNSLENKKINAAVLANVALKHGNTISKKRIGWVLDKLKVTDRAVFRLQKNVSKSRFLTPLNPMNNKGPVNKKWKVIENVTFS